MMLVKGKMPPTINKEIVKKNIGIFNKKISCLSSKEKNVQEDFVNLESHMQHLRKEEKKINQNLNYLKKAREQLLTILKDTSTSENVQQESSSSSIAFSDFVSNSSICDSLLHKVKKDPSVHAILEEDDDISREISFENYTDPNIANQPSSVNSEADLSQTTPVWQNLYLPHHLQLCLQQGQKVSLRRTRTTIKDKENSNTKEKYGGILQKALEFKKIPSSGCPLEESVKKKVKVNDGKNTKEEVETLPANFNFMSTETSSGSSKIDDEGCKINTIDKATDTSIKIKQSNPIKMIKRSTSKSATFLSNNDKSSKDDNLMPGIKIPMTSKSMHFVAQHIKGKHKANKPVNSVGNFHEANYRLLRPSGRKGALVHGGKFQGEVKFITKEPISYSETGWKNKGKGGQGMFVMTGKHYDDQKLVQPVHLDGQAALTHDGKILFDNEIFSQCTQTQAYCP